MLALAQYSFLPLDYTYPHHNYQRSEVSCICQNQYGCYAVVGYWKAIYVACNNAKITDMYMQCRN